jgi:hypothetical protein
VLILIVKIIYDYNAWLDRRNDINDKSITAHFKEWVLMAVASIPSIVILTKESGLVWYLAAPLSGAMIAFFIWLFFDGIYNLLRGFNWWYNGSDEVDDAKTDTFLKSIPVWLQAVIKIGGLVALITIYIVTK